MAGSINKVILVGNLGADPEVRQTNEGMKIVNLSLATTESWKDRATGERRDRTEWHRVVIFNENLAGIAERFLRKGSKVYIEGQLQTRKWTDANNIDRYSTEVVLPRFRGEITMLDSRSQGDDVGRSFSEAPSFGTTKPQISEPSSQEGAENTDVMKDFNDDIPF